MENWIHTPQFPSKTFWPVEWPLMQRKAPTKQQFIYLQCFTIIFRICRILFFNFIASIFLDMISLCAHRGSSMYYVITIEWDHEQSICDRKLGDCFLKTKVQLRDFVPTVVIHLRGRRKQKGWGGCNCPLGEGTIALFSRNWKTNRFRNI